MKILGKKGTTLAELLVAMAILGIIIAPLSLVFYIGYKDYFEEYDKMLVQQRTREVMEMIITDLRKYEGSTTNVDSVTQITVKTGIVYRYNAGTKTINKNGSSVLNSSDGISITAFSATQDTSKDEKVIMINITAQGVKGTSFNLDSNYRIKSK